MVKHWSPKPNLRVQFPFSLHFYRIYSLRVKHTAHNGTNIGSIPIRFTKSPTLTFLCC